MKKFSIGELEHFSGVKAHTIRIWETRYRFPKPERNLHNLRYYGAEEARRFFHAALLHNNGWRISNILHLTEAERHERLAMSVQVEDQVALFLAELVVLMWQEDIEAFEQCLDNAVERLELPVVLDEVIAPFLERADLLSYRMHSTRIHFVINALRRKIISGIETIPRAEPSQRALLFLPKSEHYDLVLLYAFFKLRQQGIGVLYLGTNIDENNLAEVLLSRKVDFLVGFVPETHKRPLENYVRTIAELCTPVPLVLLTASCAPIDIQFPGVRFKHFRSAFWNGL